MLDNFLDALVHPLQFPLIHCPQVFKHLLSLVVHRRGRAVVVGLGQAAHRVTSARLVGNDIDLFKIFPLTHLLQVQLLDIEDLVHDLLSVLSLHILFHVGVDELVFANDVDPTLLSDEVANALRFAPIDEHGSLVEAAIIGSNYCLICVPQNELAGLVELVANVHDALGNEEDLLNFFKLFVDDGAPALPPWLQVLKHAHDELSIVLISPGEKHLGDQVLCASRGLRNGEGLSESAEEFEVEEVSVQLVLRLLRELFQHLDLVFIINGLVPVMRPLVLEVLFNPVPQWLCQRRIFVELLEQQEELSEAVTIVKVGVQTLVIA